jgi:nucleotide-binding universal stress UspA family protein
MKKILVPCDFSASAVEAYQFAREIAILAKGEIHVLKAIDLPVMMVSGFDVQPYAYDPNLLRDLRADAEVKFQKLISHYGTDGFTVAFHVKHEAPVPAIRHFIKENGIDLVIMGTKGSSGINEYLIGSTTEKVVRLATVPVIAVRKSVDPRTIRKIVFPTTLKLNQQPVVEKVKALQAFFGASLEVLWINTPMNFKTNAESQAMLEEFARAYKLDNYRLHVRNDTIEEDAIAHFAREIKADMIAMTTHARRGLAHALMGSVTEDVVNHIQCPIWTSAQRV